MMQRKRVLEGAENKAELCHGNRHPGCDIFFPKEALTSPREGDLSGAECNHTVTLMNSLERGGDGIAGLVGVRLHQADLP